MALCMTGIVVLVGGDALHRHGGTGIGDMIVIAGMIGFAVYTVLAKKVTRQYDTISMNTFCNIAGAILLLPLGVRQAALLHWRDVGWAGWAGLAYSVLVSSICAHLIFFWALRHMTASRLAVFTYVEPLLATFLAVIFLGEKLTGTLLAAGALILFGVYLAEIGSGSENLPADTAGA